jgi:hypothetical protein
MKREDTEEAAVNAAVDRLIDDHRIRCLWFVRADYYPATREERLKALDWIERRGDREAFLKARTLRRWFSRHSSETSAGS